MKIVSWNVNGLRACLRNGFSNYVKVCDADIILVQETQTGTPITEVEELDYNTVWCFAERKGYSGTLCLFRNAPEIITRGIGNPRLDMEGRVITLEYRSFYVVNVYVPNSQANLARKYYRMEWDEAFLDYINGLQDNLPVIIGGDFNVAREYIDIFPENLRNEKEPVGFATEERDWMERFLDSGFIDAYRYLYPKKEGAYTWWSNRLHKREENRGWRIDYFLISDSLSRKVKDLIHRTDVKGSDHCPIELLFKD